MTTTAHTINTFKAKGYGLLPIIALSFLVLSLTGCGKSDPVETQNAPTTQTDPALVARPAITPLEDRSAAIAYLHQIKTTCGSTTGCNPAVGSIGFLLDEGVGRCTGFLISPDIVATNSHCIPPGLKTAGSSCAGHIVVNFPSSGGQRNAFDAELFECSEVIFASDMSDGFYAADYAFIRLQRSSARPPLSIDHSGYTVGEKVKVVHVAPPEDHSNIESPGKVTETVCQVARQTFYSVSNHPRANMIEVLSHCPLAYGDSGSPVLAMNGKVIGIFHQLIEQEGFSPSMRSALLNVELSSLVRTSSFSCIAAPNENDYIMPDECTPATHLNQQRENTSFGEARHHAELVIESTSLVWRRRNSSIVQWGVRDLSERSGAAYRGEVASILNGDDLNHSVFSDHLNWRFSGLEPLCVHNTAVSSHMPVATAVGLASLRSRPIGIQLPTWNLHWVMNRFMQSTFNISRGASVPAILTLSPVSAEQVHVTVDTDSTSRGMNHVTPFHFAADLPFCDAF